VAPTLRVTLGIDDAIGQTIKKKEPPVSKPESSKELHAAGTTMPTGTQWIVLAAAFLGWMFDGVEIGLFPLIVRPALQDLGMTSDADIAKWNSVVVACFLLGAAAGGVFFGWLGDKIGRVRAMVLSILAYSLFTGACYFAVAPWQLGLFRFIASLGMGGEWALAVALVMECWPERHRPKLAGAIGAAANFGFLFIALVGLGKPVTTESWRWMMLVGAAPAVLALVIIRFVPESEKWKDSVKKGTSKPIREIFAPGLIGKTFFAIVFSAIPLIGTWAAVSGWIPMWVDQMTQIEAGKQFLEGEQLAKFEKAAGPEAEIAVLKETLTEDQWRDVRQSTARSKAWIQLMIAIGAIAGCFIAPVLGGMWGRRPVYFLLCLLSLASCAYLFRFLDTFNLWFMIVVWFVGTVTAAFYGWLPLYLPELFPTRVRATGQGLGFNFGRILAAIGTFFMGGLVALFGGDYGRAMAAITLVYLVGMVLIWLAPETKGKPLPD
jgi:SHS family sialic acid transporter-like MFS transporter